MATTKTLTRRELKKLLKDNGYHEVKKRGKGSHLIFENDNGHKIIIPLSTNKMLTQRLVKENNLESKKERKVYNYEIA